MYLAVQEGSSTFIDWGFVHISIGNLVVIALMAAVFVLAVVVPFPGNHGDQVAPPAQATDGSAPGGGLR